MTAATDVAPVARQVSRKERIFGRCFIAFCALFYAAWAFKITPFNAPDERMRYVLVVFMVDYHALPVGTDPSLRDAYWGMSYAFQPFLSYMIEAVFVTIANLFGADGPTQLLAARMFSVMCGTGTVAICVTLGRRFFAGPWRWFFPLTVGLLPEFAFLNAYVNNDALGLLSTALVVWAWVRALDQGWTLRNALLLGVALSVCSLSYYNTVGYLLLSVVFCAVERVIAWRRAEDRGAFWRQTGTAVAVVSATWLLLASWFFIRNGLLYNGDFFGLATSNAMTEQYGVPESSATVRSGMGRGWSLFQTIFGSVFLPATVLSAIGMFGYQDQWIPVPFYLWYIFVWFVALLGCLALVVRRWVPGARRALTPAVETPVLTGLDSAKRTLLLSCFAAAGVLPWALSIHHAYTQDFQPQGRYVLSMLVPMMFFVVRGLSWIVDRFFPRWRTPIVVGLAISLAVIALHALIRVVH